MIEAYTGAAVRAAEQPMLDAGYGDILMRRAALGLSRVCETHLRRANRKGLLSGTTAVILVGSGNNGGDGLWTGSFLRRAGVTVTAILTGSRAHPEGLKALRALGGSVVRLEGRSEASGPDTTVDSSISRFHMVDRGQALSKLTSAHLVIDAMLGTGASGGLRGEPAALVADFNNFQCTSPTGPRIVACDVVSGVDADTGEAPEPVLQAHATVTFGAAKVAHVVAPGEQASGQLTVIPIGIEDRLENPSVYRLEAKDILAAWPRPTPTDTKYTRGVLGVVAGTPMYPGAAIMSTHASVNAGAGMVRFLGDATTRGMVLSASPEVVCSDDQPWDVHVQAWLAGPGVANDESQSARVQAVVEAQEPAVLDAGALTPAAQFVADGKLGAHKILTPHAGELAQVFEWLKGFGIAAETPDRPRIEAAPVHWAREAARLTGATVLLKGATTIIASPSSAEDGLEPVCLSIGHASPWLATAGSGDTLAGILGTVVAHVSEHTDSLRGLGKWACGDGRWAAAAALGAGVHALASRVDGAGPVPPMVLAANVRTVLRKTRQ